MAGERPIQPEWPEEVLYEFQRVGNAIRVAAIDPVTGIEVTMVGALGYGRETLKWLAARKLAYVIAKRRQGAETLR